jgi:hypothetical protein
MMRVDARASRRSRSRACDVEVPPGVSPYRRSWTGRRESLGRATISHCCKRVLTDDCDSFSVGAVKPPESFWEAWERIRTSADPDPLEVLQVAVAFSRYFETAQKEAISFARSAGLSWEQIAESLGQSRQALWQRASRDASLQALLAASGKRRWDAVKRDPISWYGETKAFPG